MKNSLLYKYTKRRSMINHIADTADLSLYSKSLCLYMCSNRYNGFRTAKTIYNEMKCAIMKIQMNSYSSN